MNDLEKQLGGNFYRCHRGYLVNDVNGEFVGVYDIKDDAETAKKEYEITPDMKAEIKEVPRSKYVKN